MWRFFLAGLIAFEVLADIAAKEWSERRVLSWAMLSIALYVAANTSWLFAIPESGLARGAAIFSVASMALAYFIGVCMYGETLTLRQNIGTGLGLVALVLLL